MANYGNCDWMNNKHATEFSQWDVAKLQTIRDKASDSPKLNSNASSIRIRTASNEHWVTVAKENTSRVLEEWIRHRSSVWLSCWEACLQYKLQVSASQHLIPTTTVKWRELSLQTNSSHSCTCKATFGCLSPYSSSVDLKIMLLIYSRSYRSSLASVFPISCSKLHHE